MNFDILMPILVIAGIAVGLGIFLSEYLKSGEDKFDERQLIERGRGANLAMNTAFSFMLCLFVGHLFDLIRMEHMAVLAVYGLLAASTVYDGYCIFHDAYLNREQKAGEVARERLGFGAAWMALALFNIDPDTYDVWIKGALALGHLSTGVMLLIRERMVRNQERRMDKEEADG